LIVDDVTSLTDIVRSDRIARSRIKPLVFSRLRLDSARVTGASKNRFFGSTEADKTGIGCTRLYLAIGLIKDKNPTLIKLGGVRANFLVDLSPGDNARESLSGGSKSSHCYLTFFSPQALATASCASVI
jgi:hypothetical protein